jgi:Fusaric acid resistance protein-like
MRMTEQVQQVGALARVRGQLRAGRTPIVRALRVTVVACLGFYLGRFVLHSPALATYALFGTIALGALAQLPSGARQRATTLLTALPVGALLICVGTLTAVNTAAAVAGMAVVGFAISYAGVGGPVVVGVANGLQLLYILPCFPPYQPGQLPLRLAGLCLGVVLLVLAELLVLPERAERGYVDRLATALDELTGCVPGGVPASADAFEAAARAAEDLRPSRVPAQLRPAAATRPSLALNQAAAALRFALARLSERHALGAPTEQLPELSRLATDSASALRGGPLPDPVPLARAAHRLHLAAAPSDAAAARQRALLLAAADGVWTVGSAVRIYRGAAPDTRERPDVDDRFWYAAHGSLRLLAHKLGVHLTPRSVYFQSAVRVALALAAARLIAGGLELAHGFWVLLATLTVLRSRAADTRTALRPALAGTLLGALAMTVILVAVGTHTTVYVVALPAVMLAAFVAGPLLGPAWAQGGFTVTVGTVFAQLAPANWRLAEARVLDVLFGAAVGVAAGVCAWPRGGAGELRRDAARLLRGAGAAIRETTAVATGASAATVTALLRTRRDLRLAEASFTMYQSERPDRRMAGTDWQALFVAGHHIVNGGAALRSEREPCSPALQARADQLASASVALADRILGAQEPAPRVPVAVGDTGPGRRTDGAWLDGDGAPRVLDGGEAELIADADVLVWLDGVAADLARVPTN